MSDIPHNLKNARVQLQYLGQTGQELVMERFTLERMVDETEAWIERVRDENPTHQ